MAAWRWPNWLTASVQPQPVFLRGTRGSELSDSSIFQIRWKYNFHVKKKVVGGPRCVVQIIHISQTVKSPPFKTEELEHQLVETNHSRSHNLPAVIFLPSNLTCIRKKLTIYVNFRRQDKLTVKLLLSITPRKQICPRQFMPERSWCPGRCQGHPNITLKPREQTEAWNYKRSSKGLVVKKKKSSTYHNPKVCSLSKSCFLKVRTAFTHSFIL